MKQKTAVDYLFDRLSTLYLFKDALLAQRALEEAKEMEKEQSKNDFIAGMEFIPVDPNRYDEDAEQYYNETYKP